MKRKNWNKYVMEKMGLEKEDVEGVTFVAQARALSWRAASCTDLLKKREEEKTKATVSASNRARSR